MNHLDRATVGQISRAIGKSRRSLFLFLRGNRIKMDDHPSLYDVPAQQFENPSTPEVVYLLGYLWADGCLWLPTNTLTLDCVADDMKAIAPVLDKTGEWLKTNMHRKGKRPSQIAKTVNARLARFLVSHGFEHKSTRSPDSLICLIPERLRHFFWRGYFDGDGCVSKGFKVSVAGSFEQDWTAWEKLLLSLNVSYAIRRRVLRIGSKGSSVCIDGQTGQLRLLDYLYSGFFVDGIGLHRKHAAYQKLKTHAAKRPLSKTGFLGVHRNGPRFYAKIAVGSKRAKVQTYIGFYDTAEEAARAFDRRAIELRGPTTRINFPLSDYVSQEAENNKWLQDHVLSDRVAPANVG